MVDEAKLLTCRALEAPHTLDPLCGLPAAADSIRVAGFALCEEHLADYLAGDLARNGVD